LGTFDYSFNQAVRIECLTFPFVTVDTQQLQAPLCNGRHYGWGAMQ